MSAELNTKIRFPVRTVLLLTGVLLAVIVPFLFYGEAVNAWTGRLVAHAESHRASTGLLLALLLASDILVPVPSSLVSTACGLTLGFVGGTVASFAGMSLTSAIGYGIGRFASAQAGRLIGPGELALLTSFHRKHGAWLLLALRPVPVLAEASAVFYGIARQPFGVMLAVTAIGNLAVSMAYAAVGVWGRLSDSFLPAFGVSMLVSGVLLVWVRRKRKAAER